MSDMLSQDEINALLKGTDDNEETNEQDFTLSDIEIDAIGEVSNISMGAAATTLFTLVNQKVTITTPRVSILKWDDITKIHSDSFVAIQIVYKDGLSGTNLLLIKENDAKIISDLMMGGDGKIVNEELTELHLSAVSEAMNQMIGSAATSMSSLFNKKIDINPPISTKIGHDELVDPTEIADFLKDEFIGVAFKMQVGNLIDSEMLQLYPTEFAKEISSNFLESRAEEMIKDESNINNSIQNDVDKKISEEINNNTNNMHNVNMNNMPKYSDQNNRSNNQYRNIEVQQAQFQNFNMENLIQQKENIDLIMDVSLEVTVELGRTHKSIKEILEFSPGTIIELNKVAGEPIDVLVNGKIVAKGEVVVIDENFGIRITDIIKSSGRFI